MTLTGSLGRAALLLLAAPVVNAADGFALGVAAGDVTDTAAILWTRADAPGAIRLSVGNDPSFDEVLATVEIEATTAADLTVKADVTGLSPGTQYYYCFKRADDSGIQSPIGRFRTAPDADEAVAVRAGFSGDSNFRRAPFPLMSRAAADDPDFFIWFGDTIYADASAGGLGRAETLEDYRAKYRQMRSDPHIQALSAATSVWAGWDDHEVYNDYAGGDLDLPIEQRDAGYRAFFEYMPIRAQAVAADPFRTYRSFRYGDRVEVFLLDDRQYREPSAAADCAGVLDPTGSLLGPLGFNGPCAAALSAPRSMLGAEQFDWLTRGLAASRARYKLVVSSVVWSFLGPLPYDRWDGYDAERRALLEFIDAAEIDGVILMATDIHASGYNPDLAGYFRRQRPDYHLPNAARVAELIAGPIGTETFFEAAVDIGSALLRQPPEQTAGLVRALQPIYLDRLRGVGGFDFFETNRFAYALLEFDTAGGATARFRGLPPEVATAAAATVEEFRSVDLNALPTPPCFLLAIVMLAGPALLLRLISVQAERPAQRSGRRKRSGRSSAATATGADQSDR
jgi:alkaline phosphatase D